jgi:hypothetical protein
MADRGSRLRDRPPKGLQRDGRGLGATPRTSVQAVNSNRSCTSTTPFRWAVVLGSKVSQGNRDCWVMAVLIDRLSWSRQANAAVAVATRASVPHVSGHGRCATVVR